MECISLLVRRLVTGPFLFWIQQQRYMFTIRRTLYRYKLERYNSWRKYRGLDVIYPFNYRVWRFVTRVLCASFCPCCHGGRVDKADFSDGGPLLMSLRPDSFENRVLKSFLALCCGIFLTVLLNMVVVRMEQSSGLITFLLLFITGTVLMLGAAFIDCVRCIILLILPQMFSREGRMALMAYIYFLVLTGPAENFTANVEVLSKGLSCGQEKIANETRRILEVATSPLKAVYEKAKQIIQLLLDFAKLMKKAFLSIKNLFAEIFGALRRALQWLYHIVSVCNKRMGEPYEKCRKPLEDAFQDCVAMMPSLLNWLCSPVRAVQYICYIAKVIMLLCAIPAIIIDFVKVQVIDRIESVPNQMKIRIEGEGPVADMYRAVADAVSPSDMTKAAVPAVDVQNCLQRPYSPDMDMYYWIGLVYILGILLMLCQTYGLRLRHVVLGIFYPDQDRSRAAWLHSHLLALRTSWLTGLRRAIRRRFGDIEESREPGLYDMLLARVPVLRKTLSILGIRRQHCLACGVSGNIDDEENFKRCETPTCRAVYCNECFEELENLCTVCMNPAEYGDLSDVSEERDSSEADDGPRSQVSESIHDFLRFKLRCSRSASQLQPCVENV
ncbi:DC-STAMP domain-containing protein 2-like isoform X4 [Ornithodoros turicata]|uniref:DC-STAMP domain-containing protein 2-like isoform X4 n=1 Tax=Ornithodoros turicata TaxID=34597 RepID=UPI003138F89A